MGIGVGGELGNDWGLGADLGFVSILGDLGPLKDFRWGGALRNLGRAYPDSSASGSLGNPPAFTPALGASFAVVKTKDLKLAFAPDLSFPSFQDVRAALGMTFSVADILFLNTAYTFDARQVSVRRTVTLLPVSFGITLKLNGIGAKAAGQDVTEFNSSVAAAPLEDNVWGFGLGVNVPIGVRNVTPPAIALDTSGTRYISPNFDGVQDDLVLPLGITDKRYVKGYRFIVTDPSGVVVRTILNKEDRPEDKNFKNILSRLTYLKTGIAIPPTIRWDGMSDEGVVVPGRDLPLSHGGVGRQQQSRQDPGGTVVVKVAPPSVAANAAYLIFSPGGDGSKETLPIQQTGSSEDSWVGTSRDIEGAVVRTFTWQDSMPPSSNGTGRKTEAPRRPTGCTVTMSPQRTGQATWAAHISTTSSSTPAPPR